MAENEHPRIAVVLRKDFIETAAGRGLSNHTAIADAIRVHQSTVGRVIRGETEPSNTFIAGFRKHLGAFDDFFEIS
jgi:hypothetical protein